MTELNRAWLLSMQEKLHRKMLYAVEKAQTLDGIPYTTRDGVQGKTKLR